MKEQWKDIPDYENYYQVSSLGRIRSLDRVITRKNKVAQTLKGQIKSNVINDNGYLTINLYKEGFAKCFKIHRLIALAFIKNPSGYSCVNHVDGIKTNNSISNLEWCSHAQNNKHAYDSGLRSAPKTAQAGACHGNYKSDIKATEINTGKVIILKGSADMENKGFSNQRVYKCANGQGKTHKGYTFERVSHES